MPVSRNLTSVCDLPVTVDEGAQHQSFPQDVEFERDVPGEVTVGYDVDRSDTGADVLPVLVRDVIQRQRFQRYDIREYPLSRVRHIADRSEIGCCDGSWDDGPCDYLVLIGHIGPVAEVRMSEGQCGLVFAHIRGGTSADGIELVVHVSDDLLPGEWEFHGSGDRYLGGYEVDDYRHVGIDCQCDRSLMFAYQRIRTIYGHHGEQPSLGRLHVDRQFVTLFDGICSGGRVCFPHPFDDYLEVNGLFVDHMCEGGHSYECYRCNQEDLHRLDA